MSRHLLRFIARARVSYSSRRRFNTGSTVFQKSQVIANVARVRDRVAAIVGDGAVATSEAVRAQHGQDEGPEKGRSPDVVAFPTDVGQVSEVSKGFLVFSYIGRAQETCELRLR